MNLHHWPHCPDEELDDLGSLLRIGDAQVGNEEPYSLADASID